MRKIWYGVISAVMLTVCLSACSGADTSANPKRAEKTITYQSESGPVEVPADPQRVIVYLSFAGHAMKLGANLVGVDQWTMMNPRYAEYLTDTEEISDEDLEEIIELDPDLIIGLSSMKNLEKMKEIAPTVTFTYGKLDYLSQFLEIGKHVTHATGSDGMFFFGCYSRIARFVCRRSCIRGGEQYPARGVAGGYVAK